MEARSAALALLVQEARALLTRLDGVKPFMQTVPMVMAAALAPEAQNGIELHMADARRRLTERIHGFLKWLEAAQAKDIDPQQAQRRFILLRLQFNAMLTHYDMFADAMNQRSESGTGIWLCGLDEVAADALRLPGNYYQVPPVVCYLDRGYSAAIRRARTRLPGGGHSPVAIIRVPRERMIGTGIASSLVHEAGHQGAALLGLVRSLRAAVQAHANYHGSGQAVWRLWDRWVSEIVADLWAVARLGIAATSGLWTVVTLPRFFVFRMSDTDPHPAPWIRVKLSCAMGDALYPHPQWRALARVWETLYPLDGLSEKLAARVRLIEQSIPDFVELLVRHRPRSLRGKSLPEALASPDRRPERLAAYYSAWRHQPRRIWQAPPTLAFAVLGQARADGRLDAVAENNCLSESLARWALRATLQVTSRCPRPGGTLAGAPLRPRWRQRSRNFTEEKVYAR